MATNVAATSYPIRSVGDSIWYTLKQTSTVPTNLNYRFEVLVYNKGTVATIPQSPSSNAIGLIDLSTLLNSYLSYDFQPTITYSYTRPNSSINYRLKWTSYTGSTALEYENTSSSTLYFTRSLAFNGSKRIADNWSYQDYLLNANTKKPMSEFTSQKMLTTDWGTLTTFNGQIGQDTSSLYTSYPAYMILDVTYSGTGFDYPTRKVYSLTNRYPGSLFTTDNVVLQDSQRIEIEWPMGPANILANTGISTNPVYSFRKCYQSGIGETMTPATIYPSATYDSGTTILTNAISYQIYWVSALPSFTTSAATFLVNLEANRVSTKYTITLESECKYTPVQLSWLNEMGAFEYFTFRKANSKNVIMNRKVYDKYPYTVNSTTGVVSKETYKYGRTAFDTTISTSHVINTDWITDTESLALETLWSSAQVFAYIDSTWKPIILDVSDMTIQRKPEVKMCQYSINFVSSDDKKTISQ